MTFVVVGLEHTMGDAVGDEVHRAAIGIFKHLCSQFIIIVCKQRLIQARHPVHQRRHHADIVGDKDHGHALLDAREQIVDAFLDVLVHAGGGLIQE